jgi:GAF domain-containing protein/ActR/RegA family two-component response regulator
MNATSITPPARILLCDPTENTLAQLGQYLEAWGFQALPAASNAEALHLLRIALASANPIDLLLVDIAMLQGGVANLLEQIRADKDFRDLPVIVLGSALDTQQTAVTRQADELLSQPLDPAALLSRASSLIRRSRAERKLTRLENELAAQQKTDPNLFQSMELKEVLDAILDRLSRVVPLDSASLMLVDGNCLKIAAHRGFHSEAQVFSYDRLEQLRHVQGVLKTGLPEIIPDTHQDPRWFRQTDSDYIRSWLGIPLFIDGQAIGLLNIDKIEPHYYSAQSIKLASDFATQAAIAIDHARTYHRSERYSALTKALVKVSFSLTETYDLQAQLEIVRQFVAAELEARMFYVGLYDEISDVLELRSIYDGDQALPGQTLSLSEQANWGLSGWVIKRQQPLEWFCGEQKEKNLAAIGIRPHLSGVPCETCLIYPLQAGGRILGVISIQSDQPYAWDEIEVDTFRALTSQVSVAIQTTLYLREIQEGQKRLYAAYAASKEIVTALEPGQAVRTIVKQAVASMGAWWASVLLLDTAGSAENLVTVGLDQEQDADIYRRSEQLSRLAARLGIPIFIHDVTAGQSWVDAELLAGLSGAAACLPLILDQKPIGAMWAHYKEPRHFSIAEQDAWKLYANMSTIAIRNARRMQELDHMRQAGDALAGAASTVEVLEQVAKGAMEVLQADATAIWSYDDVRDSFILESSVAVGIPQVVWEEFRQEEPRHGQTTYTVMEQGWIGVNDINDLEQYPYLAPTTQRMLAGIGVHSFQGIALKVGEERLGVLYVNYTHPREFDPAECEIIRTFANQAALALKKAKLLEQVSKARNTARQVAKLSVLGDLRGIMESIVEGTLDVLDCDAVTLYTYDAEQDEFGYPPAMKGVNHPEMVVHLDHVEKNSVPYRIVAQDDIFISDHAATDPVLSGKFTHREGVVSFVGIPLIASGRKVGIMCVNYRRHHHFTTDEITNIRLFSDQAAVAIDNAFLFNQEKKQTMALQVLYKAGEAVISTLSLQEILTRIAEQAWELATPRGGFSHLAWVENDRLTFIAAYPSSYLPRLHAEIGEIDLSLDRRLGIVGRVAKTGISQLDGNATANADYIESDKEIHTQLSVPIELADRVIGVISVEHPERNAFDAEDRQALMSLASYAAAAINNARQYQSLQRQSQYQEAVYAASKVISARITVEKTELLGLILQETVQSITSVKGAKALLGIIQLYDAARGELTVESIYPPSASQTRFVGQSRRLDASGEKIGIGGRAIFKKESQRVPNVHLDPDYIPLNPQTLSELSVPLMEGRKGLGVISLESEQPDAFDDEDEKALSSLAELAVIAIQNAQAYKDLKQAKLLVGNMATLAWTGTVAGAWRHSVGNHAAIIGDQVRMIRDDLQQGADHTTLSGRLVEIDEVIQEIQRIPMNPLQAEEGVDSVYVNRLIRERLEQYRRKKGRFAEVCYEAEYDLDEDATVRASPEWLRRLIDIFIDNAINAMQASPVKVLHLSTGQAGGLAEITVSDTGAGIPAEIEPLLFLKPILKAKGEKGSGVGLYLAAEILRTYNGSVEIKSTGQQGTNMRIRLPLEN